MGAMRNAEVAQLLNRIARLMEIKGENRFKFQAFADASRRIDNWPEPIEGLHAEGRLREIPGVGTSLARYISEYLEGGHSPLLEELTTQFPLALLDLEEIPGVGPKLAVVLFHELGVRDLDSLEQAISDGRLQRLPRLGEKSARHILQGIKTVRQHSGRISLGIARPLAESILAHLQVLPAVQKAEICGSLRRWKETIGDIDVLVATDPKGAEEVMEIFTHLPEVRQVLLCGPTKSSVRVLHDLQVDLRVVPHRCFGAALQYFTGSQAHNVRLRELAIRAGLKLNEYGLFRLLDDQSIAGENEEEVYAALGLPWIPPELREDQGEVEAAQAERLPKLIEQADLVSDLHLHSDWSDGLDTARSMVEKARSMGYQYLAFTDHGEVLEVAHGLSLERFRAQRTALEALSQETSFPILCGVEANVLANGSLDFPSAEMDAFDWVIAGIHTGLASSGGTANDRLAEAMTGSKVDLISHPSGRLIGEREPYALDRAELFQAASLTRTALEINSHPKRLDLRDIDARQAKEAYHLPLAICSDAHSTGELDHVRYGVAVARRAWLTKDDVLNTRPLEALQDWVARRRRAREAAS